MDKLIQEILKCEVCKPYLKPGPKPIFAAHPKSKIVIIGQAPGCRDLPASSARQGDPAYAPGPDGSTVRRPALPIGTLRGIGIAPVQAIEDMLQHREEFGLPEGLLQEAGRRVATDAVEHLLLAVAAADDDGQIGIR